MDDTNDTNDADDPMEGPTSSLLFVESEPLLLPLKSSLRKRRLFVFESRSSETALHITRHFRFNLIFVDLLIPSRLSGYDLCKKLREDPLTWKTPIFLFCNHSLPPIIVDDYFFELKAERLILPPFNLEEVSRQICLLLQPK